MPIHEKSSQNSTKIHDHGVSLSFGCGKGEARSLGNAMPAVEAAACEGGSVCVHSPGPTGTVLESWMLPSAVPDEHAQSDKIQVHTNAISLYLKTPCNHSLSLA